MRTVPPGGENERALSIRLSITCPSRESWPGTTKLACSSPSKVRLHQHAVVVRHLVGHVDHGVEQSLQVDRLRFVPLHLGVEAAGVRNIGDQPVEPLHVVLDDRQQTAAAFVVLGERQRLDRRAQRGERVLELVRDVGGEALDRVDAAVERVGHVPQRAREMPDLVAPLGEVGDLDPRANAPAHELRAFGQPPHRSRDGAGEQERQHHHHAGGDQEYLEDGEPLGADHIVDVGALRRQHERAAHRAEALHRDRHRDDHLAALVDAHHARLEALERVRHLVVALAVLRPELAIERQGAAAEPGADRRHRSARSSPGLSVVGGGRSKRSTS